MGAILLVDLFFCRLIFLRFFAQIMSGYRNFIVSHHANKFSDYYLSTTFFGGNSRGLLVRIMLYQPVSMLKHSLKNGLEQLISLSNPCRWYAYNSLALYIFVYRGTKR